jgi:hypothetical protein
VKSCRAAAGARTLRVLRSGSACHRVSGLLAVGGRDPQVQVMRFSRYASFLLASYEITAGGRGKPPPSCLRVALAATLAGWPPHGGLICLRLRPPIRTESRVWAVAATPAGWRCPESGYAAAILAGWCPRRFNQVAASSPSVEPEPLLLLVTTWPSLLRSMIRTPSSISALYRRASSVLMP